MKRLLLVEDDVMISQTLQMGLHYRGYEVTACGTLQMGRDKFRTAKFDAIILDVNLPDGTGYTLCKEFRQLDPAIPVLMLTARVDETSAVAGIDSGADDYVRKPFGLEELTARLNRLVGRKTTEKDVLSFHSLNLSLLQRLIWVVNTPVTLYKREFDILALLMQRGGEVVSREEMLNHLEGDTDLSDRTIDSHLSHLRRKLKEAKLEDVQIAAVYGVGYRLEHKPK